MHEIIGREKQASHWGVQSRFRVIYIYSVCRGPKSVGGITWAKSAHAHLSGKIQPVTPVLFISTLR